MSNWSKKTLDSLCEIELGKTPYRGNKKFWDAEKQTNNVWLSIADLLNTEGKIIFDSKEYISDEGVKLSKIVKKGMLLVSFKLTLGRLAFAGKDLYTNEAIAALSIKNEKELSKEFLYNFLSYFDWNNATEGDVKVKGKTLNKSKLKEIEIPLPPLSEQKRIVKILDEVFEEVEKAKENAEKSLRNSRELFEAYLQSVFENGNGEWEKRSLGEIYDVRDGTHDSPKYQTKGFALVTSKNLKRNGLNFDNIKYISERDYEKVNDRSKVDKGDILFAMIGTIGNPIVVEIDPDFAIKNVALFKVSKSQSNYFLRYYLASKMVVDKMARESKGTTQKFVGLGYLRDFKVLLPPLSEQKAIVKKLDALSEETKKLEEIYKKEIADLEELKKSVLQKAFRGEL